MNKIHDSKLSAIKPTTYIFYAFEYIFTTSAANLRNISLANKQNYIYFKLWRSHCLLFLFSLTGSNCLLGIHKHYCNLTANECSTAPLKASSSLSVPPLLEIRMSLPSLLNLRPVHSHERSYCNLNVANGP